jgi:hypothetical protein
MNRQFIVSGFFLLLALLIWVVLLRPIPVRNAAGVIRTKTLQPPGVYLQYQPGARGSFRTPTQIPIAEHFELGIEVPGERTPLRYAANTVEGAAFDVGQPVTVEYQERGFLSLWRRVYVLNVKRQTE